MIKDGDLENAKTEELRKEIVIVDEKSIRDKIYTVRGVRVMLDFELAEIYGYETKNLNRQIKNNAEKFYGDDFKFQLTKEEFLEILRCKNFTSSWGGTRYLPIAFTEQGVYMLMTVLRGELATKQSRALVKAFKVMKDYVIQNQALLEQHRYLKMMADTQQEVVAIRKDMDTYGMLVMEHDERLVEVMEQLSETVKKSELSPIMLDFNKEEVKREYLFLAGQPMKADAAYISIYAQAGKTIHIVDDYISTKTLHLLQDIQKVVKVTIFSDNICNKLAASDYVDYQNQFPGRTITFKRTLNKAHDRFIILDYGTKNERVFHCGPSSKDAGKKMAAITEFSEGDVKKTMHDVVAKMLGNQELVLS